MLKRIHNFARAAQNRTSGSFFVVDRNLAEISNRADTSSIGVSAFFIARLQHGVRPRPQVLNGIGIAGINNLKNHNHLFMCPSFHRLKIRTKNQTGETLRMVLAAPRCSRGVVPS